MYVLLNDRYNTINSQNKTNKPTHKQNHKRNNIDSLGDLQY